MLETYGTRVGEPVVKHIDGDIWEIRPGDDRIFFACWKDNRFILLHQYTKKSQKAPRREIETAMCNLANHKERNR
jgi:phage-related protein